MICSSHISFIFIAWSWSFPLQEIGRAVGIALRKQFGWQADLRAPDLEVGHLSAGWPLASSGIVPRVLYFFPLFSLLAVPQLPPICLSAAEFN